MTQSELESKLDKVFAEFIKKRDNWTCRRCHKRMRIGSTIYDPAHMMGRGKMSTRWSERNVFGLDRVCHTYLDLNREAKKKWYDKEFGDGEWEKLELESNKIALFTDEEIIAMIKKYS